MYRGSYRTNQNKGSVILNLVHSFPGLHNDCCSNDRFWGFFPPNVVKAYSDVSEEVTASLFRVTRTVWGGCWHKWEQTIGFIVEEVWQKFGQSELQEGEEGIGLVLSHSEFRVEEWSLLTYRWFLVASVSTFELEAVYSCRMFDQTLTTSSENPRSGHHVEVLSSVILCSEAMWCLYCSCSNIRLVCS